jgi:NAD(P)-dependent dehydrogenase (short-subunit alcohol dehydrogenase family)
MGPLSGKTVLITGAKGGLGTFVTQAFLDAGANVFGASRSIRPQDFPHERFTALPAELSNKESAMVALDALPKIDATVHLIGVWTGGRTVQEIDSAELDRMLDLNFRSAFVLAQAVLPRMRSQASGRFLAIASRSTYRKQRCVQRRQGCIDLASTNNCGREWRFRNHGECRATRDDEYSCKSSRHANGGPVAAGRSRARRGIVSATGGRSSYEHQRCSDPHLRRRSVIATSIVFLVMTYAQVGLFSPSSS